MTGVEGINKDTKEICSQIMEAPVAELTKEPGDKSRVLVSDISNCGWIGRRSIASAEAPGGSGFRQSVLETESSLMCLVRTQRVNTLRPEAEDGRRGRVVSGPRSQGTEGVLGCGTFGVKIGRALHKLGQGGHPRQQPGYLSPGRPCKEFGPSFLGSERAWMCFKLANPQGHSAGRLNILLCVSGKPPTPPDLSLIGSKRQVPQMALKVPVSSETL